VNNKSRHHRLRMLLKKLNKERKKQAKQIDILCNDIIAAQRDFIKRLKTIDFRANFYESIMGTTDLSCLLSVAAAIIKEETDNASVIFFLRQAETFEMYSFGDSRVNTLGQQHFENCFNPELMTNICMSNKICTINDMFAMGLQGNLIDLNTISTLTIPLGSAGSAPGFMLIYRSLENKLTAEEIQTISAVTCGLSQAIFSCQALMHSSD